MQVRRTTTKCVSPISRNMGVMGVKGFIIEFWLVIRTDNYTRSSLPAPLNLAHFHFFFLSNRFGPAPFFDCFATIYERTWRGNGGN